MIEAGVVYRADLNEETPRAVVVVSNARFARLSGRALVAPQLSGPPDELSFPWRVEHEGQVFAVDRVRSISVNRLIDEQGHLPRELLQRVHAALTLMT